MSRPIEVEVLNANDTPFTPPSNPNKPGLERYRRPGCGLILFYIIVAWGIEIIDTILGGRLDLLGLHPRDLTSLYAVFTMPWLHGGFGHLISNSTTFLILGYLVLATEKHRFYKTTFWIMLLSGLGTWLIGRPDSIHIGASALIYGYFGYLLSRSFLEKRVLWTLLGIILFLAYGGMIWGVLPSNEPMSWEGHLAGFLSGIWMANKNLKK